MDEAYGYLMLFTGDPLPDVNRRSLAVEPMTCPPNAFRTGEAVIRLEPGELVHEHVGAHACRGGVIALIPLAAEAPLPDAGSLVLVLAAASAGAILSRLHRRIVLPTVVLEIVLGILIGPEGLGLAEVDSHIDFLANLGLVFLFFFAGLELVEQRVARRSLVRGTIGWAISLAIGVVVGLVAAPGRSRRRGLAARRGAQHDRARHARPDPRRRAAAADAARLGGAGRRRRGRVLADRGHLDLPHGRLRRRHRDAAPRRLRRRRAGSRRPRRSARARRASSACSSRPCTRRARLPCACPCSFSPGSSSSPSRWASTSSSARSPGASSSGLALNSPEAAPVRMRLEGVGFGFLIPIYFVVTGMNFDLDSLLTPTGLGLAALFLGLFLVVRGTPSLLWLRDLGPRRTLSLALFGATGLPLIVAIVGIGTDRGAIAPTSARRSSAPGWSLCSSCRCSRPLSRAGIIPLG